MQVTGLGIAVLVLASAMPAAAVECRSVEGNVMGEPLSTVRAVTWDGLRSTLTLGKATVSGGKLNGETMPKTTYSCTRSGKDAHCEKKDSRRTTAVELTGKSLLETVTLKSNGNELMRISYECDGNPIRLPEEFEPFSHEDRHVVLHAQSEAARFCAGKNIETPVSLEMLQEELTTLHTEQKIDAKKDFYEFQQRGRRLLGQVEQRLLLYPEQGCAALLAALPSE